MFKDYVLFPLLSGPSAPFVLAGNATANLVRNLWAFTIIFCGHFPDGTVQFTEAEMAEETRGQWYYRQLLSSADLTGGKLFHVLSGHLSHQIEHHLCSPISPPTSTTRSPSRCARSASTTSCHTTQGRSSSNSGVSFARSPGSRCPAVPDCLRYWQ